MEDRAGECDNDRVKRCFAYLAFVVLLLFGTGCGFEAVVRLATQVYEDGTLHRRLEVTGREDDGSMPTEEGWLREKLGLELADPKAWDRVVRAPGRLMAEGYFPHAGSLPAPLAHHTEAGRVSDRNRATLSREDRVILTWWVYRETYGDPFGASEVEAALDGLADLAMEALGAEVRRQFGRQVNPDRAASFLCVRARALAAGILQADREAPGRDPLAQRRDAWIEVLTRHGVTVTPVAAGEDFWEAHAPHLLQWLRDLLAHALSTDERPVAPEDLYSLLPNAEEWPSRINEITERVWGSEEALEERAIPYLEALIGYYGGGSANRFRFEASLRLPGVLLATNGTPAGEEVAWFFRDEDITLGEVVMTAESVELDRRALRSLGSTVSFSPVELLRLRDILVDRDPEGELTERLSLAVAQGDLAVLSDTEGLSEDLTPYARELVELLDPSTSP